MYKTRTRRAQAGFTIVEMMVVTSIILLLLAILLPSMARARYVARLAACNSNFHQWGVGTLTYASDYRGFFPSQRIGRPKGCGQNSWDVSNDFLPSVIPYDITWQPNGRSVWYCPLRPHGTQNASSQEDALYKMQSPDHTYAYLPLSWWVARLDKPTGGTWFPSAPGDADGWPRRASDPVRADRPILTDRLRAVLGKGHDQQSWLDGHVWQGVVESTSLLYSDGHTEQHFNDQIKIQYQGNLDNLY
ncbi:MAG: DUF1559 domain-containing protein [Phycisphaera sp.]|nr:DUF1559 domain-containing protein [Phycisphaera sp.]